MSNTFKKLSYNNEKFIAYNQMPGKSPGVVFLTGFKSDMTGTKALALEKICQNRNQAFLRFDYTGHGQSSGKFEDGTIGDWTNDTILALDNLCNGPQILVGSSMGGWIMLLAALARPENIVGLVGIAAAPDFTEDLLIKNFSESQLDQLQKNGYVKIPNCYNEEPYIISKALLDEGQKHLLLKDEIPIDCPVRLIHGELDQDVPWKTSFRLSKSLRSQDVSILFVKGGDHRMSEPQDLDRLCSTLENLLDQY